MFLTLSLIRNNVIKRRYDTIDPMARPPLYDDALRDRLLDAAAEIIDHKGPERLSLRDAAQAAGTSTSAVYALFGGKAQLLTAVIEHGFASFGRAQADAEAAGLRALGVAYRVWALENPALYRLMFGGALLALADCTPDPETTQESMMPLVRALMAAGILDPFEAQRAALAVWAQVHGTVSLEFAGVAGSEVEWDAVYDVVLDSIERGFPAR